MKDPINSCITLMISITVVNGLQKHLEPNRHINGTKRDTRYQRNDSELSVSFY